MLTKPKYKISPLGLLLVKMTVPVNKNEKQSMKEKKNKFQDELDHLA